MTRNILILFFFAFTVLIGCDRGQVINQKERDKILHQDWDSTDNFSQGIGIYNDQMTPQSEYTYQIYNGVAGFYLPLKLNSLLKIDTGSNPSLLIAGTLVNMNCVNENVPGECLKWSYRFNVQQFYDSMPSLEFTIDLIPISHYKLSSKSDSGEISALADYQVYQMFFSWKDSQYVYFITKQKFFSDANLTRGYLSFANSQGFNNFFYSAYYWPNPSYESSVLSYEMVGSGPDELEFVVTFQNVRTDEQKKRRYTLNLL